MSISFVGLGPEFGVVVKLVVQVSCSVLSTKIKTGGLFLRGLIYFVGTNVISE